MAAGRGRSAPPRVLRGAEPPTPPLSLIPTRLALPITAARDGAPSASAIARALLPSSANVLRTSIASSVHNMFAPLFFLRHRQTFDPCHAYNQRLCAMVNTTFHTKPQWRNCGKL
ncbi:MAG TPA: hypothetical protein VJY34_02220 [Roseiarcus sp.]|nr:hypothetical protein [Roseiarcus sp.]